MSPSVHIRKRETASGPRYDVRYRMGGRFYPVLHAGTFKTQKEARERRNLVAGEIAAGRDPQDRLRELQQPVRPVTFAVVATAWRKSRIDHEPRTQAMTLSHMKRILPTFGHLDPASVTPDDVQAWIVEQTTPGEDRKPLRPSSIERYFSTLAQIFDHAGVDPNPCRDRRVRLPRVVVADPNPPTGKQFLALLARLDPKLRLPAVVLEQTAMRVGELCRLCWGDVDVADSRFRLQRVWTKTRSSRWVQVPRWLMDIVEENCPLEDRTADRSVFPGLDEQRMKRGMTRAATLAGIPHTHPHDLRHRRLTIWHHEGVPARLLAERAGHARASMTLDRYSHTIPPGEADQADLARLLDTAR